MDVGKNLHSGMFKSKGVLDQKEISKCDPKLTREQMAKSNG